MFGTFSFVRNVFDEEIHEQINDEEDFNKVLIEVCSFIRRITKGDHMHIVVALEYTAYADC